MKYKVTHVCGHTQVHDLFGPAKQRDQKIAWLSKQVCTDCWRAAKQTAAARVSTQYQLPELQGTERQVAWAKQLRAEYLTAEINQIQSDPRTEGYRDRMIAALIQAVSQVRSAADWIEHRAYLRGLIAPLYEQAYRGGN